MIRRASLPAFGLVGVLWMLLAGCAGRPANALTLVIISPHREEIRDEVETGFSRWLDARGRWPGQQVQIEWRDIGGGTGQILRYLEAQYQQTPDGVGIDLLYGGGTDIYFDLKDRQRLQPFLMPPELKAKIPHTLRGVEIYDAHGEWHGVMLSSLAILLNRDVLERIGLAAWSPAHWRDLGDPRLFGWVSAGDPRMSGSVHMLYEVILQKHGWEEGFRQLMRIGANARAFARFSDAVSRDVVLGKVAAGGTLDSYASSALTRHEQEFRAGTLTRRSLEFVLPKGETVLNPDSIGILHGAPHAELAAAFVEYNLSEDGGQRLWMLQPQTLPGSPARYNICRLSVMERLYDPQLYDPAIRSVQINPFEKGPMDELVAYSNQSAKERWNVLNDLFGSWIIDPHHELHATWQALLQSRLPPALSTELEARLFAPPCTERELRAILAEFRAARAEQRETRRRAETVPRWLEQARQRYAGVRAEIQRQRHARMP